MKIDKKTLNLKILYPGLLLGVLYCTIAILTMHNYGIAPDNPYSYFRGERIFQYLLSGERKVLDWWTDMNDYTAYESGDHPQFVRGNPDFPSSNRPEGYDNSFGYIASAVSCYIFYRVLRLTDAKTAHRLSNIFFGALLIMVIYWFAAEAVSPAAGFFSALAMFLYPRLFILVQGNIKDVPMLSMYVLTVWAGWRAVELDDWRWLLVSAIAMGLGIGSKSTAGFALLVLLPFFLLRQIRLRKLPPKKLLIALLLSPLICYLLMYASKPNYLGVLSSNAKVLQQNAVAAAASPETPGIFQSLLGEWRRATSPSSGHANWIPASMPGWTSIRARFAFFVTPMVTNLLAVIGAIVCFKKFLNKEYEYYFILITWLFIPLFRTAAPYSVAYGGIRLYVDYVPPLCLLAGLGASQLIDRLRIHLPSPKLAPYVMLTAFLPLTYKLVDMHPYQGAFFNFLLGGNGGAMERKYPYTGDINFSTHPQAIAWFNQHAEPNARIIADHTHLLNGFGLRKDLKAIHLQDEALGVKDVYYLTVPISWTYKQDIPWSEGNRRLVKEVRVDDSPVWLIYKHKGHRAP